MLRQVNQSTSAPEHQPPVKTLCLCVLSAVLLILPFANPNYWVSAWIGFVPLFLAIAGESRRKAFLLSFFTGAVFWLGTIYWLTNVTVAGYIVLSLYLAIYFGVFGLIVSSIKYQVSSINLLFFPSFWVLLEHLRTYLFTGFPWALLAYSQYKNLSIIQIADMTGAYGVSFLVMTGNVLIYSVVRIPSSVSRGRSKYLLCSLFIFLALIYGYYQIYGIRDAGYGMRCKVSLLQPNIPQELKWNPAAGEDIIKKYFQMTKEALLDKPDLIIWPETAVQDYVIIGDDGYANIESTAEFIGEINVPVLLGAVSVASEDIFYNSALFFSGQGEALGRYDKIHLVPFGEYIPLRNELPFLEAVVPIGDFTPGKEYAVFQSPVARRPSPVVFSTLICFEDVFPDLARNFVKKGAGFLVNITNDAWFGDTSEPYQHVSASVFRAVENRRSVVRAANTGISCFISPQGMVKSLVANDKGKPTFVEGHISDVVFPAVGQSFYTKYGDVFVLLCFVIVFGCGIIIKLKSKNEKVKTTI